MRTYNNTVVLQFATFATGNAGAIKPVTVLLAGTQTKADLFDESLVSITNPVNTDDKGNYTFTVDDGTYDIVIDKDLPTEFVIDNEQISNTVDNPPLSPNDTVNAFDVLADAVAETNPLKAFNGSAANLKERTTGNGGGAMWDYVLASSVTPNTFNIVQCVGVPTLALVLRHTWFILDTQFGCPKDGTTDGSPATQAALDYIRNNRGLLTTLIVMPGTTAIETPLVCPQGVNWVGSSSLGGTGGGCEYLCNFSASTIANPPTDNLSATYSPVLAFSPMIYNTELLTQQKIGGFRLNGNNKDVYGMYFNEWYYVEMEPTFIIQCNKYPFTGLVGQFNNIKMLSCNVNKAGLRFIRCSSTEIEKLDTESNLIPSANGAQLEIIGDSVASVKATVSIGTWHYEESETLFPDVLAKISGRNVAIDGCNFGLSIVPPLRFVELLGAEAYSFDGINITTVAAIGASLDNLSFSTVKGSVQLNAGCVGAMINVNDTSLVVDNSASTSNQVDGFTAAQMLPRGVTVKNSSGGNMMSFTDDNTINLFDDTNRTIKQVGANLAIGNVNGQVDLNASTNMNFTAVDVVNIITGNYRIAGLPTSAPVATNSLWSDSGTIKIT